MIQSESRNQTGCSGMLTGREASGVFWVWGGPGRWLYSRGALCGFWARFKCLSVGKTVHERALRIIVMKLGATQGIGRENLLDA